MDADPRDLRIQQLEAENQALLQRVDELEQLLATLQQRIEELERAAARQAEPRAKLVFFVRCTWTFTSGSIGNVASAGPLR